MLRDRVHVLIVDPEEETAAALTEELATIEIAQSASRTVTAEGALQVLRAQNPPVDVIYLDPCKLGKAPAQELISAIRSLPWPACMVFFTDLSELVSDYPFYIRHCRFYMLEKRTPASEFSRAVRGSILSSLTYLSPELSNHALMSVRRRLEAQKLARERSIALSQTSPFFGSVLGPRNPRVDELGCFVLMPYSIAWFERVWKAIEAAGNEAELNVSLAADMTGRSVLNDIWLGITGSRIVVADITGTNANVVYELGLADAARARIVLISQDSATPFDFGGQRVLNYQDSLQGLENLQTSLARTLKSIRHGTG